jgi:hypothetical protein
MSIVGALLLAIALPFLVRGWALTLKPDGPTALRVRERNLRRGLEADMRVWGRRVRRFGTLLALVGLGLVLAGLRD